jgi:FAD-dependent urate hydroxylase
VSESRALIVGGGIGGLSAALALQRSGLSVTLFEEAREPREVGTGIGVWINGMSGLRQLGAEAPVTAAGAHVEFMDFRSRRGKLVARVPTGELSRKHGVAAPIVVRRPDLLAALREPLPDAVVQLGSTCVGFEEDAEGVTVNFADGREERGAFLIGADGIDSTIRQTLRPQARPRYAGYQYLRALTEFSHPLVGENTLTLTLGPGDRFGLSPVAPGWLYWFAVILVPAGRGDLPGGRKQELLDRFSSFAPPILEVIESTHEESILPNDIRDIEPFSPWGSGRVTLMGDAAHATTPNGGRGAGEAIEDAITLAGSLASAKFDDAGGVVAALRNYEAEREQATAKIQTQAWRVGRIFSWRSRPATRLRNAAFRTVVGRGLAKAAESDCRNAAA